MAKWTESDKLRALAIAEVSTIIDASQQTGIPPGNIKRWRYEKRKNEPNEPSEPVDIPKKIQGITQEAIEQATISVTEIITRKSEELANRILSMVQLAIDKTEQTLHEGPNENEPRAGWLKATIGAMHMGVDKAQLLTGQPTQRQEVITNDGDGDTTRDSLESIRTSIDDLRKMRDRQFPSIDNEPSERERPIITH